MKLFEIPDLTGLTTVITDNNNRVLFTRTQLCDGSYYITQINNFEYEDRLEESIHTKKLDESEEDDLSNAFIIGGGINNTNKELHKVMELII